MNKLTTNNKDYLFSLLNFIKEQILLDEVKISNVPINVNKLVDDLVGRGVIDNDFSIKLKESLTNILYIMFDNPGGED